VGNRWSGNPHLNFEKRGEYASVSFFDFVGCVIYCAFEIWM